MGMELLGKWPPPTVCPAPSCALLLGHRTRALPAPCLPLGAQALLTHLLPGILEEGREGKRVCVCPCVHVSVRPSPSRFSG